MHSDFPYNMKSVMRYLLDDKLLSPEYSLTNDGKWKVSIKRSWVMKKVLLKVAALKSLTFARRRRSHLTASSTFMKPGASLKKLKSGERNWHKKKILKSDRIQLNSPLYGIVFSPSRHRVSLTPFWHHKPRFLETESKKMPNIRPMKQFEKNLSGVNVFNEDMKSQASLSRIG